MNQKVSIIIPVYMTEKWLPKCIESCIGQTYSDIQIILVDDGSPDNSGKLCDFYAQKDKRILVIHQKNNGVSVARNTGLLNAEGKLVLFVDSDDWLEKDMIEKLVKRQLQEDFDLTICGWNAFQGDRVIENALPENRVITNRKDILFDLMIESRRVFFQTSCAKLFKNEVIKREDIRFDPDLKEGEDFSFVLHYIEHIETCAYLSEMLYCVQRMTYDKTTHYQVDNISYQWNNNMILYQNYKDLFVHTGMYKEFMGRVDIYLLRSIKCFLNNVVGAGCKRNIIIPRLRLICNMDIYQNIVLLNSTNVENYFEKVILFCCKHKLWNILYFFVSFKLQVYNRFWKSFTIKRIGKG